MSDSTREERLCNPMGIMRVPGVTWAGQAQNQLDDRLVTFTGPGWGMRAGVKTLQTYQTKDGVKTMRQAIHRWAPPNENDTEAYIDDVCERCSVGEDDEVNFALIMPTLVKAIVIHENGRCIYDDAAIAQAIAMAGAP